VDVDRIADELRRFIARRGAVFDRLSRRYFQILEVGALTFAAEHYRKQGYALATRNLDGGLFHVKQTAQGVIGRYSWFECTRGVDQFSLYMNLPVFSENAIDDGVYVVDVGVANSGAVTKRVDDSPPAVSNDDLLTLAEVKAFRVYPMALAHFLGIVHELRPECLARRRPYGFLKAGHFAPTLFTLGTLTANSERIVTTYRLRKFRINVVPGFDRLLSRLSADAGLRSPLRS
jgi:hypothetical protein